MDIKQLNYYIEEQEMVWLKKDFHNKCHNKGKTICLSLNDKDNIFGGFSSILWTNNRGDKIANDCFLFIISNIYNTKPTKFPYVQGRSAS